MFLIPSALWVVEIQAAYMTPIKALEWGVEMDASFLLGEWGFCLMGAPLMPLYMEGREGAS